MALFTKEENGGDLTHRQSMQSTQSSAHTVIGSTVHVDGKLSCDESVTINGTFKGTLDTKQDLTVGNGASVEADIVAENIIIAGTINGNIRAKQTIDLKETAVIKGDITAESIAIAPGASINGMMTTGASAAAAQASSNSSAKSGEEDSSEEDAD
jgi:cytoskeletal protein CcmA (bactofilin family)